MRKKRTIWILLTVFVVLGALKIYDRISYNKLPLAPYANVSWKEFKGLINDSLTNCNAFKDSVMVIRNFTHVTFRAGNAESYLEINDSLRGWDPEQWFLAFSRDSFSGSCDHAARYLKALYQTFGFESYLITIAKSDWSDGKGHITNVVARQNNSCPELAELYWTDAFFNTHFEMIDGKLLTLEEYFTLLKDGQISQLRIAEASRKAKYLQDHSRLDETDMYTAGQNCNTYRSAHPEAKFLVECPRTLSNYLKGEFAEDFADIAWHHGFELDFEEVQDFKYAFLLVRDIGGEIMVDIDTCRQELLKEIQQKSERVSLNE